MRGQSGKKDDPQQIGEFDYLDTSIFGGFSFPDFWRISFGDFLVSVSQLSFKKISMTFLN
jgi:hypothetical protein